MARKLKPQRDGAPAHALQALATLPERQLRGHSRPSVAGATVSKNIVAYNGTYGIDSSSSAPSCPIRHNLAFSNGAATTIVASPPGSAAT